MSAEQNYPREEWGGARGPRGQVRASSGTGTAPSNTIPQTSPLPQMFVCDTGWTKKPSAVGHALAKELPADCRTVRLEGLDSSISCCMACKSSVAETTGNRSMRRQIKIKHALSRCGAREPQASSGTRRQTHRAGNASVNQRRLSRSSMFLLASLRLYQRRPVPGRRPFPQFKTTGGFASKSMAGRSL